MSYPRFFCSILLSAVAGIASALAFETNGDLDLGFDPGKLTNGQVEALIALPDSKVLIVGGFGKVNGVARHNIARLNTDGSLDTVFDPGAGSDADIQQVIRQPDGKLIITGFFSMIDGVARNGIARLSIDGALDASFNPGALISSDGVVSGGVATNIGVVNQAALQSDGKVIVIGQFGFVANGATTSAARSCVARFTSTGAFDSTYNPGTGMTITTGTPSATHIVLQTSGKAVIQGAFDKFNGNSVAGFVRLDTTGAYDSTFSAGTATPTININGLFVQGDDRIVVFGGFSSFNGASCNSVVRLLIDGGVDAGFATGVFQNYAYIGQLEAVAIQPDGKLVVGGIFYSIDGAAAGGIARLNTNGTRDLSFVGVGTGTAGEVMAIGVRAADNRLFIGGYFSTYNGVARNNIVLGNIDGSLNPSFSPAGGATDYNADGFAILPQADGKVIVGGLFSSINGVPHYNLARFNNDGSLDNTFGITIGTSRSVRAMARQSTGKIIIVGSFFGVDGVACGHVARLNTDGTLDATFNPGTGVSDIVYAVAIDSSDNIYLGGSFATVNGSLRNDLAKLGPNGALDLSFDPLAGPGGAPIVLFEVRAIAPPTATAGPVIGGFFTTYQGTTVNRVARLNATTAALDTAFTGAGTVGFNSNVRALSLTPTGQYYATGQFASYRGTASPRLARLTSTGALDATFTPVPAPGSLGRALLQQNGKIVLGGSFASPTNQLVRYSSTGTLDATLNPGSGVAGADLAINAPAVDSLAVGANGKMYVGGIFTSYNGMPRYCLARLTRNTLSITSVAHLPAIIRLIGKGEASTTYNILSSPDLAPQDFTIIDTVTTNGSGVFQYDAAMGANVIRFFELGYQ